MLLFYIGLTSLWIGFFPSLRKISYVYMVYSFFVNYFKPLLDVPVEALKITMTYWLAQVPLDKFNIKPFLIITVAAVLLMLFGSIGYRMRNLKEE